MKSYLILFSLFSILSCQKNSDLTLQNNSSDNEKSKTEDSTHVFKTIGVSSIKDYNFPKEWLVNTYDNESSQIKKADLDAQKKLEEIDYFNKIKGSKMKPRLTIIQISSKKTVYSIFPKSILYL